MKLRADFESQRFGAKPSAQSIHSLYGIASGGMLMSSAQVPSITRVDRNKTCYPSPSMRSGRKLSRSHFFAETRRFDVAHAALTRRASAFVVSRVDRGTSTGANDPCVHVSYFPQPFSQPRFPCLPAPPPILSGQVLARSSVAAPRPSRAAMSRRVSQPVLPLARCATTRASAAKIISVARTRALSTHIDQDHRGHTAPVVFFVSRPADRDTARPAKTKGQCPCSRKS